MAEQDILEPAAPATQTQISPEQAPPPSGASDSGGDVEARARAQGWRPQEEFGGPPERWKPADEFLARADSEMPVLRERLDAMTRRVASQEKDFADQVRRMERMNAIALQKQAEQIEAAARARARHAAEIGDVGAVDAAFKVRDAQMDELRETAREVMPEPQKPQQQSPAPPPEVEQWVKANPWFMQSKQLNEAARDYHQYLLQKQPGLPIAENLRRTREAMRRQFPAYFDDASTEESAPRGSPVEGGTSQRARQGLANRLPPAARESGSRYVREGLFKNLEEYARDYFAQDQQETRQ